MLKVSPKLETNHLRSQAGLEKLLVFDLESRQSKGALACFFSRHDCYAKVLFTAVKTDLLLVEQEGPAAQSNDPIFLEEGRLDVCTPTNMC